MTTQSYKALKGVGNNHKPSFCKASTKGEWWSPDQGFLVCLKKLDSLFINTKNTYPYVVTHAQTASNTSHFDSTAYTLCDNTLCDPYQQYMKCQTEKKRGEIGQREKASYPYANMQIRALLGSLHVIEVWRLSVESVENITSPTLQDVMNRTNIL